MTEPDPRRGGPDDPARQSRRADALQHAPWAFVEHTAEQIITDWNAAAERLFGYARDEAIGRSVDALLLPDRHRGKWPQPKDNEIATQTLPCVRKDGTPLTCAWTVQILSGTQGGDARVLCYGHDATPPADHPGQVTTDAHILRAILDSVSLSVWAIDTSGTYIYHDGLAGSDAGVLPGSYLGLNLFDIYAESPDIPAIRGALAGTPGHTHASAHGLHFENWYVPLRDEQREVRAMLGVTFDVTEKKQTEEELRAKLALIEQQKQVIRDLSTPIIEVWERVLTLPMVGVIDSSRTAEVMDTLLEAVVRTGALFVILDLTGVEAVDTRTAAYLFQIIAALQLLGAQGIITGIRGTVAQTMVQIGLNLSNVTTLSNLRAGLKHCMRRLPQERRAGRAGAQR